MVDDIKRTLRDSKAARWTALLIVSFSMLCGYYVADIMSPLKPMIEQQLGWSSSEYGFFTGAYAWFNVFLAMLIFGGVILDKKGPRFAGVLGCVLMVVGCGAKYFAISTDSLRDVMMLGTKAQVLIASVGFAIFGVGIEICGITRDGIAGVHGTHWNRSSPWSWRTDCSGFALRGGSGPCRSAHACGGTHRVFLLCGHGPQTRRLRNGGRS